MRPVLHPSHCLWCAKFVPSRQAQQCHEGTFRRDGTLVVCAQLKEKAAALAEAEGRVNQLKAADARQRLDLEGAQRSAHEVQQQRDALATEKCAFCMHAECNCILGHLRNRTAGTAAAAAASHRRVSRRRSRQATCIDTIAINSKSVRVLGMYDHMDSMQMHHNPVHGRRTSNAVSWPSGLSFRCIKYFDQASKGTP